MFNSYRHPVRNAILWVAIGYGLCYFNIGVTIPGITKPGQVQTK